MAEVRSPRAVEGAPRTAAKKRGASPKRKPTNGHATRNSKKQSAERRMTKAPAEREPIDLVVDEAFTGAAEVPVATGRALPPMLVAKKRERAQRRIVEALQAAGATELLAEQAAAVRKLVARWAETGFDDGFKDVETFEVSWFADADVRRAQASGDARELFDALSEKHRAAIVRDFGRIEIRGLQVSERVYQSLDVAYVPLRVRDETRKPEKIKAGKGMEIHTIPRVEVPELLRDHERTLLVGAPGGGKSTIVAYLAAMTANGELAKMVGWSESPVPFVVPVRSLADSRLDPETIAGVGCEVGAAFVLEALEQKRALVLVDGLDEARKGSDSLVAALRDFVKRYPGNRMFVTSRPGVSPETEKVAIPGFVTATIEEMARDEVYAFIDKWCLSAEQSLQKDPEKARQDAEKAADDLKGRVRKSMPVERLAQTPLICSALCITHRFLGQQIPERRVALYEVCTNVLLYEWDRAKFPHGATVGELDAHQKRYLLSGLALWMHEQRSAEASREEVLRIFRERLPALDRKVADAEKIVFDIQDRSGILLERRPGYFAFSHLTFQEYLAAVEIVREGKILSLVEHHEDRWWHEVTALTAGQPSANAAGLIRGLLAKEGKRKRVTSATLLAAQCIETAIHVPASVRDQVQRRICSLIPPSSEAAMDRLVALGDVAGPLLVKALGKASPDECAWSCAALGKMRYEAAVGTLLTLLHDRRRTTKLVANNVGKLDVGLDVSISIEAHAELALFNIATYSPYCRTAFEEALRSRRSQLPSIVGYLSSWLVQSLGSGPATTEVGAEAMTYLEHVRSLLPNGRSMVDVPRPVVV